MVFETLLAENVVGCQKVQIPVKLTPDMVCCVLNLVLVVLRAFESLA